MRNISSLARRVRGATHGLARLLAALGLLLATLLLPLLSHAQTAAAYSFGQATGATYTPITGGAVLGTATNDDHTYTALAIGFPFSYLGTSYTTVSVNANGWLRFGSTIASSYNALASSTVAVAAMNRDLQGTAANVSEMRYQTLGSTGSRQLVVQWKGYRRYYNGTGTNTDNLNFQIILNETTNSIQLAYGTNVIGGSASNTTGMPQVGINGAAASDFNDRTSTTDWTATTAGTTNAATITLSTAVVPPAGLVYTLTPPAAAPTLISLNPASGPVGTSITLTGTNLAGATAVSFNGTAATTFSTGNGTTVTATVPAGATSGNVTVTTPGGTSNGQPFTVGAPTITLTPTTLPDGQVGAQYPSIGLSATGGTSPYTFALTSGALPAGLTLGAGGSLSGTPTAGGTFSFTATATDAAGFTGSQAYTLTITPPSILVIPTSLNSGNVGMAYSQQLQARFGTAPYTFAITSGALPAGLTLSAGGLLSGTPTAGGSFPFTVTATDASTGAGPYTGSTAYTLGIQPAQLSLNPGSLPDGTAGTAYSQTVTASGGISPYTYTVTSGTLPTGLSLTSGASGGVLAGIPTASGFFRFEITATDASTGVGPSKTAQTYTVTIAAGPIDLVVTTTTTIPAGTYNSITVNSPGVATLGGNVTVNTSTTVNNGATLNDGCNVLSGAGSFTLAAGGTLGICNAAGISTSGATGAIQNTGARSFSTDASYVYNGTAAQRTGAGLPAQVRNLRTSNSNAVTLSQATSVAQVLTVAGSGNLATGGNALTLLSSSTGTALLVNSGSGLVSGAATIQRYIDPSLNPSTTANPGGKGYRHYSSPVASTTVADLTTTNFAPVLTQSYNSSATPGTTTPFPNVFGYDQSRLVSAANSNYSAFDKGWVVPAAASTALAVGQGYAVNIAGTELVDFVGTPNTGTYTVDVSRNTGTTAADAGWNLVGNPYPAPLDYAQLSFSDLTGTDRAMYVVQSTGQYAGQYRSYVNGNSTNPAGRLAAEASLIAAGQGFFVRVSQGQTSGTITFQNYQRVTSYDRQSAFQRLAADTRPSVRLTLAGAGLADGFVVYAEAGATAGFDSQYDAAKLPNPTGLNLSSATPGDNLAIDGRAAFTAATVLPLNVGVPAAGTYTLAAADVANLPAGLTARLRDAATGQTASLAAGTAYSFSVSATEATALLSGRFTLQFSSATPLATAASLSAAEVTVYPNPAQGRFTVLVPAVASAASVQAELLNTLGQVVRRQSAALPAAGATLTVETAGLATGVYTLRLTAGASTLAKRVVLQ